MNHNQFPKESAKCFITFELDAHSNKLLKESSEKSNRTKRREALLRLSDHLERFETISQKGDATPRQGEEQG